MAILNPEVIVYGSSESIEAADLCIPVRVVEVPNIESLDQKVSIASQENEACLICFFVLLLDFIGEGNDPILVKMVENDRVIAIFNVHKDRLISRPQKLFHIPMNKKVINE